MKDHAISSRERLILALDVATVDEAKLLVERLGSSVEFYKLGLELFMAGDYFELIRWLHEREKKVFADLKFFDIPETVAKAVRSLSKHGVRFATVHGNEKMIEAAAREKNGIQILAVTVLTSLDRDDMRDLGFQADLEQVVVSRAKRAIQVGGDGVISSGHEALALRDSLGGAFLIVVPGIRPPWSSVEDDDQKRVVTPEEAFRRGADYIVVGRPIREAADPKAEAERFQDRIRTVLDA